MVSTTSLVACEKGTEAEPTYGAFDGKLPIPLDGDSKTIGLFMV
jgi:hypothetical protein